MPFDEKTLETLGYRLQPDGSYVKPARKPFYAPLVAIVPRPKPQCPIPPASHSQDPPEAQHSGIITVRITGFRCRLLDADNFAGGCKILIDCLRAANLIPDDDPETIELVTRQVRVKTKQEEGTEVKITHEKSK